MSYVLAIAGLGVACVLWYLVSSWAAASRGQGDSSDDEACAKCAQRPTCEGTTLEEIRPRAPRKPRLPQER